ncbi:MAG TPA: tRNA adenosine(34) deaminase TadA [Aquimonas sp.]|jgi:tRNA(adenine34) deaminase|nr:tRNA adenosine(34) deaminase TadA [Aquimonas sp.]
MTGNLPTGRDARDQYWMRQALALAEQAAQAWADVPVGAVLLDAQGELLATGMNRCIADHDPSAHAEIVALREAGRRLGNHRLTGSTLYVTLEPCAMCAMALVHARVSRVVYATDDPKTGAAVSVFDLLQSERHNHRISLTRGVLADEAAQMLRGFFQQRRGKASSVSTTEAGSK